MDQIDAIYRHGVLEPLQPLDLPEEQRVRLSIERAREDSQDEWLARVQKRRGEIFRRQGHLPDSAVDIAEDRTR